MEGFVFTLSNDERRILNNTHSRVSSHPTCWRRERERERDAEKTADGWRQGCWTVNKILGLVTDWNVINFLTGAVTDMSSSSHLYPQLYA